MRTRDARSQVLGLVGAACLAVSGCSGGSAALLTPGGSAASSSGAGASGGVATSGSPNTPGGAGAGAARPRVLVAVTAANGAQGSGALVVLDPVSGAVRRTLVPQLVIGDAVQVGPDGATVYYERVSGCQNEIWSVPVAGGGSTLVAAGNHPALSPDGKRLAFSTNLIGDGCAQTDQSWKSYSVRVRDLASGAETRLSAPDTAGLPLPVSHLSWNQDGTRLAVSIQSVQDNEGWLLNIVDPAKDTFYAGDTRSGPVVKADLPGTRYYFREAVFLPNGDLFAVHRCCDGLEAKTTAESLEEVDPGTGATKRKIADGLLDKDHTSLDTDASGRWLLYLSGTTVMISDGGQRPTTLTTGYQAVDW